MYAVCVDIALCQQRRTTCFFVERMRLHVLRSPRFLRAAVRCVAHGR